MQLFDALYTDTRIALRLLRRSPGYTATVLGILIVGIGATTAMFSLVVALLVRPLPYAHPEELTMVWGTQTRFATGPASIADFNDWRAQATTFRFMTAVEYEAYSLSSDGALPETFPGASVSGDFFSVFDLPALRGRLLGTEDDRVGGPRVAVVSAALWHERFGSDPTLVGKTISLNSESFTVVGIAAEGFRFSGPRSNRCDLWTPLAVTHRDYAKAALEQRDSHFLNVMGRRRPGVSLEAAQAQLSGIAKTLEALYPDSNTKIGVRLLDLQTALVGSARENIWVLFGAVGLVFLIVCANVANLLLARAAGRRGEMAARAALGATRLRLVGQLLTETIVVFVLGALGGTILARWLVAIFARGLLSQGAFTISAKVDGVALAFAIGTALVCGVVFGLAPAVEATRIEPHAVLKESGARAPIGRPQRLVRGGLVIAQVALAFALLAGSGLALRSFVKVASTPPGFDVQNIALASLAMPSSYDEQSDKLIAFYRDTLGRVAAEPGVESVAGSSSVPMGHSQLSGPFKIEGRVPLPPGERPSIERNVVTPGYFRTLGIPLLRGRDFDTSDVKSTRRVMIISKLTADRFFPGEDPIGHRIDSGDEEDANWYEIVGIVGDVRKLGLASEIKPEAYIPTAQAPMRWMTIVTKTARPDALLERLPGIVAAVDSRQAVHSRILLRDQVADSIGSQRFVTTLLGSFAVAALFLATLGLFGLVSYTTSQRTRELGIRLALGASPEGLVGTVVRGGMKLLGIGLALGIAFSLVVGRVMAQHVSGVAPFDPAVVAVILAVLGIAGALASLLPALRAVRIPPAVALRYE